MDWVPRLKAGDRLCVLPYNSPRIWKQDLLDLREVDTRTGVAAKWMEVGGGGGGGDGTFG